MANYRVEFFRCSRETGKPENQPREIMWFSRSGLSRRDISNILLACTWPGENIIGYIYRNETYIGMAEADSNDLYSRSSIIINGKHHRRVSWKIKRVA